MATTQGATAVSTPTDRSIQTERIVNAPRGLVWQAFAEPELIARWWGRGNRLDVEKMELKPGGEWRFIEHGPDGDNGFRGRYREVVAPERMVQTFEWDGMPGYVSLETAVFEDLGDGRTKVTTLSQFFTTEERDGMLNASMIEGMDQSYAALDKVLASLSG